MPVTLDVDAMTRSIEDATGHLNVRNAWLIAIATTVLAGLVTAIIVYVLASAPGGGRFPVIHIGAVLLGVWVFVGIAWANVGTTRRRKREHLVVTRLRDDPEVYAALLAALRGQPAISSTGPDGRRVTASDVKRARYDVLRQCNVPSWLQPPLLKAADRPYDGEGPHDIAPVIARKVPRDD